ncbi:MAG: hypothetical protein CM1200mP6_01990 [Anaerolineaceae bacterium]|nr:MAG: hypothetical protein CM1200mP6_01990 [Anaerolineaceae bacterium]
MSWSESPDGPWNRFPEPVLKPGRSGEWMGSDDTNHVNYYGAWDSHKVHDPFILCGDGKYWLYYKGQPMGWGSDYCSGIGWGVAIADSPYGPFEKYAGNPVTNSGHETCLFPWGVEYWRFVIMMVLRKTQFNTQKMGLILKWFLM